MMKLTGIAYIPGDKSISHRSLMCGALAEGTTIIHGLLEGEDVLATAEAMRAMGAIITKNLDGSWTVTGTGGALKQPTEALDMGNSGTSTRLLMGLVAGHDISVTFHGDASLTKRPMSRVIKPLEEMGVTIQASEGGFLPLTVHGSNALKGITYDMPVASAQVKSCLLLAGLNAQGTTTVIENNPTRDHSENMLRAFGARLQTEPLQGGSTAISITGGQTLKATDITVPADPSSAAFPIAAAILHKGSEITCPNVGLSTTRDGLYKTLQEMGADLKITNKRTQGGEPVGDITVKGTGALKGITVPADRVPSMIDEFPILAVIASCAHGTTHMTNLAELRVKESDRLQVMADGLKACGVSLEIGEDTLTIHGTGTPPKGGTAIETHLDHRIAMSFLILSSVTREPLTLDDLTPIKTSFPTFIDLMESLGLPILSTCSVRPSPL